jgi:hypothetical protein
LPALTFFYFPGFYNYFNILKDILHMSPTIIKNAGLVRSEYEITYALCPLSGLSKTWGDKARHFKKTFDRTAKKR